jgi:hypothetical protein
MAKVTYHGEYPEDADAIVQHGETFERGGKGVEVTDKALLARFGSNRFFKVAAGKPTKEELAAQEAAAKEAEEAEAAGLREYLDGHSVPYKADAPLADLQKARADHEAAVAKAAED